MLIHPRGRMVSVGLVAALLVVALISAACVGIPQATPASTALTQTAQPATATAVPTATSAPSEASPTSPLETATPSAAQAQAISAGVDAQGNFYRGDPNAPVKFVEFSDFQCPFCARHATQTGPLLDESYVANGKVQHIFRNYPLDFHPNAKPAAIAAYCAGQGAPEFFWKMHDWLFANQGAWSDADATGAAAQFRAQAVTLGADGAKYDACVKAPETTAAIQRDLQEGSAMGINGTPAFLINDWRLDGAYPFEEFQRLIDKATQGVHPAPTATPLPEGVAPYDADPARPGRTYDGSPSNGDPKARLVLVSFEDYKCSACAEQAKTVEPALKAKYVDTGQMREVFKFFPIDAPKAAVASLCALDQGKFWEFSDLLFSKQPDWKDGDDAAMLAYAKGLGLDEAKFTQCLKDAPGQSQIDADQTLGQQIGMQGTPFFILIDTQAQTGTPIAGAISLDQFDQLIQGLLNPSTPTPTPTPTN